MLAGTGVFLAGMARAPGVAGTRVLVRHRGQQPGNLASMVQGMGQTSQPGFLSSWVNGFGTFTAGARVRGQPGRGGRAGRRRPGAWPAGSGRLLRPALGLLVVLCAADWVLVQDLGVFGGLGTDPNSMIPFALVAVGGYLAVARARPVTAAAPAGAATPARPRPAARGRASRWPRRGSSAAGGTGPAAPPGHALGTASPRTVGAVGALGVAIIGVVPMAAASASTSAVADHRPGARRVESPRWTSRRPAFTLTDQHGRAGQPGQPARQGGPAHLPRPGVHVRLPADRPGVPPGRPDAGRPAPQVEMVAVVANPVYTQLGYTQAFDRQEHMNTLPNWQYLTGSVAQLKKVWRQYGIAAQILPAGGMIGHSDVAYVIDRSGRTRTELELRSRARARPAPRRRSRAS